MIFSLIPLSDCVYIPMGIFLRFLPQFRDCVFITSMCLCLLPQLCDCVFITSVMCLCLLRQLREHVSITLGMC